MIASGATLHATITILKDWGVKKIIIMGIVGCKEGVEYLRRTHPGKINSYHMLIT